MQFFDGSVELDCQFVRVKVDMKCFVIYVGVKWEDGFGLEVGNFGLDCFEIVVGFFEGKMCVQVWLFFVCVECVLVDCWNVYVVFLDKGVVLMVCWVGSDFC